MYIPDKPVKTFLCFLNTTNPQLHHVKEIGLKWPIFEIKSSNGHFHFLKKCLQYDLVEFEQIFEQIKEIEEEDDSMNHKRHRQSNGNYLDSKNRLLLGKPPSDLKEEYILDLEDLVHSS